MKRNYRHGTGDPGVERCCGTPPPTPTARKSCFFAQAGLYSVRAYSSSETTNNRGTRAVIEKERKSSLGDAGQWTGNGKPHVLRGSEPEKPRTGFKPDHRRPAGKDPHLVKVVEALTCSSVSWKPCGSHSFASSPRFWPWSSFSPCLASVVWKRGNTPT